MRHLFVYGTLMKGYWRHHYLTDEPGLRSNGRGVIRGLLYDIGSYPGARPEAPAGARVAGEIYESGGIAGLLEVLDRVEGFDPSDRTGSLFVRGTVVVENQRGGAVTAWVYWWNRTLEGKPLIAGGDYRAFRPGEAGRAAEPGPPGGGE